MRLGRTLRRGAVVLISIVIALVVTLGVTARTTAFHDWLRRRVVAQLNAQLSGVMAIGGLEGNLWGNLVLTDLRLVADGRRIAAARRVAAHYDLLGFLTGGSLVLRGVEIDGLALTAIEDAKGWNVARLSREDNAPPEPSALEVVLTDAHVTNASIKIVRRADVWRLRAERLEGAGRFGPRGQSFTLTGVSGTLPGRDLRIAELTGSVAVSDDGTIRVDDLHLRTDGSEVRGGAHIPGRDGGSYDVTVDASKLAATELHRLVRTAVPATDVAMTARLRGPAEAASVDATVSGDAGTITLTGNLGQAELPTYDLRATLTDVNVAGFIGPAQPTTALSGTVEAKGKGLRPAESTASAAVTLRDPTMGGQAGANLTATADLAAEHLAFNASATLGESGLEASGTISIADERYDLRLTSRQLDPAPLLGRPDLHARLNATVSAVGTGFDRAASQGELHLALAPSTVERLEVTNAVADVRATRDTITIDRLRVDASTLGLEATGSLTREADKPPVGGSLRFAARATDLAPLGRLAGAGELGGSVNIEGTAGGSIGAVALRATVNGRQLARGDARVGSLTATVTGDDLGGVHGRAEVRAHGEDIQAADRHLAEVDLLGSWRGAADGTSSVHTEVHARGDATRRHDLVADVALAPGERRVSIAALRLDIGDETWRSEGTPVIVQRGERVAIHDLALHSVHGSALLDGEVGTSGAQDLRLRVDGLDLADLAPAAAEVSSGSVSASAHVGGTAQAPAIEAHTTIAAPTIARARYESIVADAHVAAGSAAATVQVVQQGARALTLDASVPFHLTFSPVRWTGEGKLAGSLRANRIDVAFLGAFVPSVTKLEGQLDADLTLGGTVDAPEAHGPLAIAGGRAHVIPLGLTYDAIDLRLALDGTAATLEALRVASGNGVLTGEGSARAMAGGEAGLEVRVRLDRFPLFANQFGEGTMSGVVSVSGSSAAPIVEGALTTNRFVLRLPETLPGSVRPPDPTITVVGASTPVAATSPQAVPPPSGPAMPRLGIYERTALTIQVDIPNNAWIRRSDADIELRGWMTAWKKPSQQLALAGEIDTVRGWYAFQGRTFTLENGRVTFSGQEFDPLLEIAAVRAAGDYTVRVKVGGQLSKPTLVLESEPSLEQSDILAVLLFGKPVSQLDRGESAGLRDQAIGVASSYVASGLRESVANSLGLDTLQFESGSQGLESGSLAVGKYLAPDVFVTLAHRFAKQGVQEVRVEYRATPHWSVETSADTVGDTGIDVFWKSRY